MDVWRTIPWDARYVFIMVNSVPLSDIIPLIFRPVSFSTRSWYSLNVASTSFLCVIAYTIPHRVKSSTMRNRYFLPSMEVVSTGPARSIWRSSRASVALP
ncbi:hypothetical protein M408DRAFT_197642 [Serendipita vermifera MAFF 305830]|uniref:Uncharacterized protein n=1 Tax=Serendipita vermifera MAFF 305830 TaxID=933852 RepID=A0A0C2WPR8_SERVB|nr:hypothetical protein M408DRAFT_197642 [Serendipita vermifera MAFF 305830]